MFVYGSIKGPRIIIVNSDSSEQLGPMTFFLSHFDLHFRKAGISAQDSLDPGSYLL